VRPLPNELIDIVLAEVTLTRVVRRLHCAWRFRLGHGNESRWLCAGEPRGVSEALLHREQALAHVGANGSRRLGGHPSQEREPSEHGGGGGAGRATRRRAAAVISRLWLQAVVMKRLAKERADMQPSWR